MYRNVTLEKNGLKFQETVLFLHWISHSSHKMQTTVVSNTLFVLMLYLLYNLKNVLISERYRKRILGRNRSKFEEITNQQMLPLVTQKTRFI